MAGELRSPSGVTAMRFLSWIGSLVKGLRKDVRGNVAMLFGLSLPVFFLLTLGGF
jgi:Flp pilus assembly protein TadG